MDFKPAFHCSIFHTNIYIGSTFGVKILTSDFQNLVDIFKFPAFSKDFCAIPFTIRLK